MTAHRVAKIRADNAFPPLWGVPSMAQWKAENHNRAPWWRLFSEKTA